MTFTISHFSGPVTQLNGCVQDLVEDLPALQSALRAWTRAGHAKGEAGYFVACALTGPRSASAACPTTLLALDADLGPVRWADLDGLRYLAHTTDSHLRVCPANPRGEERWRVFLELDEPVDAASWPACPWSWAALRNISQPIYVPTRPDCEWRSQAGACVTWRKAPEQVAIVPAPVLDVRIMPAQATIDRLRHRWHDDPRDTNRLAGTIGACLAAGGWGDGDIRAAFVAWFTHPSLERHIRSALAAAARRRAGERIVAYPEFEKLCGADWVWEGGVDTLDWALAAPPPEQFGGVAIRTARDIAAAQIPEPNWLCRQLVMAPGAPSLITGYGGSGKTTFVQHLALCVAQGDPLLGTLPTRRGPVIHIDHEQGSDVSERRYQRLGLRAEADLRLICLPNWSLANPKQQAEFLALAQSARDGLLIIDSFVASCREYLEDENASASRAPLDFLTKVSVATGACILVIHHSRKDRSDSMVSARGSGAITDAVGLHITYEKAAHGPDERPMLRIGKTRFEAPSDMLHGDTAIAIAPRGAPADGGYTLVVAESDAVRDELVKTRIHDLLLTGWTGSRTACVKELCLRKGEALDAIRDLIDDGFAESLNGELRAIVP
jgi:energy-coupling factor transporter ATP-binding protein EcfA2